MKVSPMKKTLFSFRILVLLISVLFAFQAYAQEVQITGTTKDAADGSSLPGVTVLLKGTTSGTISDIDGKYSIKAKTGQVLVFSFIGYTTQEITVGTQRLIDVSLKSSTTALEEVLVIGYGTQKKIDKTGAVANIKAGELNGGVLTDPIQGLQGKAAGVRITKRGGDPNSGFGVNIRGQAGFYSRTEPIYVIDGVLGADPTSISSDDIESFTILKDAASTAIYGARGANGVILIETKKGTQKSTNSVELHIYNSYDKVAKKLDLMDGDDIRAFATKTNAVNFLDGGSNTNWQDVIFRPGNSQSYNLSSSGGNETSAYRASITHTKFSGVVVNSQKQRTTGRINLNHKAMNNKLNISATLSAMFETNNYVKYDANGPQDVLYQAFQRNPTDKIYNDDGSYHQIQRDFQYNNPLALAELTQNERLAKSILGNFKAEYEILDGLYAASNLSYTRNDNESFYFEPTNLLATTFDGYGRRGYNNTETRLLETTLRYNKIVSKHSFDFIGGHSFQQDYKDGFSAQGRGAYSNYVKSNDLGSLVIVNPRDISSYKESNRLISFFGRGVYNYNSKYYLTLTVRRDGSTRFGTNNEWGWFPSVSTAWTITNEDFMADISNLSLLKLRLSYGLSGNQDFDNYRDILYAQSVGTGPNPETGETSIIYTVPFNANPDLKWEVNKELNIGIDFGLFRDRLSGSLELYSKITDDLLAPYSVPSPPYPYANMYANAGSISNKGIELNVQYFAIDKKDFDWKTNLSVSRNVQKIISLNSKDGIFSWSDGDKKQAWLSGRGLVGSANWAQYLEEGYELGTFYMPEYAGINDAGEWLFVTATGGVTSDLNKAERRIVGRALPDVELGWSNFFNYKRFDIGISSRAVIGGKVLNVTRLMFGNPSALPSMNALREAVEEYDRGLRSKPVVNSYYLEDGSYLKIDNISLGYTFSTVKTPWIKACRLYVTSNNVFTFTKYTGLDPEMNYTGRSFGLDQYNLYPKTRTLTFGVNVTF